MTAVPLSLSSQLPEEALLGSRLDSHDWEKISNVNVSHGEHYPGSQGHGLELARSASDCLRPRPLWPPDLP